MQNVESVDGDGNARTLESVPDTRIPHQVGGVALCVFPSAVRVYFHVGTDVEVVGQTYHKFSTILKSPYGLVGKCLSEGCGSVHRAASHKLDGERVAGIPEQFQRLGGFPIVHAAFLCLVLFSLKSDQIHISMVEEGRVAQKVNLAFVVERQVVVAVEGSFEVSVHVLWLVGAYAGCRVVGESLCDGVAPAL